MAIVNRATLKSYFETNDIPTEGQFANLIDSLAILASAGVLESLDQINVDNIRIDGNTISTTNTNGDLVLSPNGSGDTILNGNVGIGKPDPTEKLDVNGKIIVEDSGTNHIRLKRGLEDISFFPSGGQLLFKGGLAPDVTNTDSLGRVDKIWESIYTNGIYLGGTASANLLDDYEEGTWTPSFRVTGTRSLTYTTQEGRYTKIGNKVICDFNIVVNTASGVQSGGQVEWILGLPFSRIYDQYSLSGLINSFSSLNTVTNTDNLTFRAIDGIQPTGISFWKNNTAISEGMSTSGSIIKGQITYTTA